MTDESEQATQSLSERAAREWAESVYQANDEGVERKIATMAHSAGQAHGEKRGFYTAIARMESALQKISDEAKEKWPDCPDWWGVVWGMKAAIEEMKEKQA